MVLTEYMSVCQGVHRVSSWHRWRLGGQSADFSLPGSQTTVSIMSICLSVCPSVCPFICLSVFLSVLSSVSLSICLSVHLSVCLSVCSSVRLSVHLSVCGRGRVAVHLGTDELTTFCSQNVQAGGALHSQMFVCAPAASWFSSCGKSGI